MGKGRQKQGMRGGPSKDDYVFVGSTVTKAKVEAESRKEQGMRGGQVSVLHKV